MFNLRFVFGSTHHKLPNDLRPQLYLEDPGEENCCSKSPNTPTKRAGQSPKRNPKKQPSQSGGMPI